MDGKDILFEQATLEQKLRLVVVSKSLFLVKNEIPYL